MDKQKKRRLDYHQKWKSARKLLREIRASSDLENSETDSESESTRPTLNCMYRLNRSGTGENRNDAGIGVETNEPVCASSSSIADNVSVDTVVWDHIDQSAYVSSDSEYEFETSDDTPIEQELSNWINQFQVKHNAVDSLLKILQKHGHTNLPSTARTLLGSTAEDDTIVRSGMDYIYFDLKAERQKHFQNYPLEYRNSIQKLEVSLNIDGLPLFSSSKKTVWPVLCGLPLEPFKIFPVALLCGESKPTDLEFLHDTITDLANLIQNGFECDNRIINITVKCIICDAPARALVKNIKQYSGYYGCDRCTQKGAWLGRLIYPEVNNIELRTDTSFKNREQEQHHHGNSPFCDLPIDMINTFSVDYMHLACLGVMRRLLLLWIRGPRAVKLSAGQLEEISRKLLDLRHSIPHVFARKPRGLSIIDRWKATELRQFLLYTGKLVLKDILPGSLYDHFLVLSVALCILVCPQAALIHNKYAHDLLVYFVEQGHNLYGPEFLVYNVHGLVHISTDAANFGSLDRCSAFPFENYLHHLKRLVRSGKNPLVQLVKRLNEIDKVKSVYKQDQGKISTRKPNNAYILSNSSCCEVLELSGEVDENQRKTYRCRVYERAVPLFLNPCDSSIIGAFKAQDRYTRMKIISEISLLRKAIMIETDIGREVIFLAILHDF